VVSTTGREREPFHASAQPNVEEGEGDDRRPALVGPDLLNAVVDRFPRLVANGADPLLDESLVLVIKGLRLNSGPVVFNAKR
jgi:hypothetical protein